MKSRNMLATAGIGMLACGLSILLVDCEPTIVPPDDPCFQMPSSPYTLSLETDTVRTEKGSTADVGVTITFETECWHRTLGFTMLGAPAGVSWLFNPPADNTATTLTLDVAASVPLGEYTLSVVGTAQGPTSDDAELVLVVTPTTQDYILTVEHDPLEMFRNGEIVDTLTVRIIRRPGFDELIDLSLGGGSPCNILGSVFGSFNPPFAADSSLLTLNLGSAPVGIAGTCEVGIAGMSIPTDVVKTTSVPFVVSNWEPQVSTTLNNLRDVSFTDADNGVAVGDGGTLLRTTTGGASWFPEVSGTMLDLHAVHFGDALTATAVGAGGVILRTLNGGLSWSPQTSGLNTDFFDVHFLDANVGNIVGFDGVILRTDNGGQNWTLQQRGQGYDLVGVYATHPDTAFAVGGSYARTTNGTNWLALSWGSEFLNDIQFANSAFGLFVGDNGTIYRSTNEGFSWQPQSNPAGNNSLFAVSFADVSTGIVVGESGTVIRTTDRGLTWIAEVFPSDITLYGLCSIDSATATAVGAGGVIYRRMGPN